MQFRDLASWKEQKTAVLSLVQKRSVIDNVKSQLGKQPYNSINEQPYVAAGGIYGVQTDLTILGILNRSITY